MSYTYRCLTVDREPIIWQMLMYAAHEPTVQAVRNQPALARYAANWGRSGDTGVVAFNDGDAVGAAWLRLWSGEDKGFGYVSDSIPELAMAVLPNYRGQGIGTRLLGDVLQLARSVHSAVSLNVREDNPVVLLYERMGFVKVLRSEITNRTGSTSFNMLKKFDN